MNTFNILLSISLWLITTSTTNNILIPPIPNNKLIKDHTYYFQTHRYNFHFNFDYNLHHHNNIISNQDLNNNKIHISLDNLFINILFYVNTSTYIFNINHNLSLNYDYDPDWNEIQTLVLTSPSNQKKSIYHSLHKNINASSPPSSSRRRLYQKSHKRGRFIGVKHPRQFHDAERVCRHKYGGELASVRNSRENAQLYSLCTLLSRGRRRACWIGLRRPYRQWTDGRSVSYKKWSPGQPDNAGRKESCTEMWGGGRWNDNRCRVTSPFICETARTGQKNKYIAVGMALDWDNANEYCHRRFDTELASVISSRNNRDVRTACNRVARRGSCWIGLERPFKKWQDGKRVRYKYWQRGEPNNAGTGESCTEIYHTRRWNDLPCRIGRFFVCNYKGTDNRNKRRRRRRSRRKKKRRKHTRRKRRRKRKRKRKRCSRGSSASRKRCRKRYKTSRRRRRERWKCSRLRFGDYERKECLRRRKGMIRRFGRRRARRRWRGRMRRRGYSIRGMGRGFRSGYQAGKRSIMSRGRRGTRSRRRRRRRRRRGGGGGYGRFRLPKMRMPRMINSRVPLPPRIQLVDLPPHRRGRSGGGSGGSGRRRYGARMGYNNHGRRLKSGQLGTGYGMGVHVRGDHKKYGMSTYALQAAMMEGASMKDLKRAAKLTDIGWKQMERDEREKKKKNNGEGDGDDGDEDDRDRRRLMYDVGDGDVYEYEDMENEKRCVLYGVYEVCVGYDFVEIKKYVRKVEKVMVESVGSVGNGVIDLRDGEFMEYIGYEYEKCRAMMNGGFGSGDGGDDYRRSHYLNVYEFVYDDDGVEQCFMNFEAFEICLRLNNVGEMIVRIENDDFKENGYSFNFEIDSDWNEIDEIIGDGEGKSIEKCVRLFEVKVCMHENDSKFKMLLYKTA